MTQHSSSRDWGELVQEGRTHRSLYTDPAIFEAEMRLIFERAWVFVGHESEVPLPGDYKTAVIGQQPVIMTRDEDGEVHVLMNRCMHRGALLCRGDARGNTDTFTCMYHSWAYNNRGDLIGVPYVDGYGPEFDKSALGLRKPARMESYRGFVFAHLSPTDESLGEYLGRAKDEIDRLVDASPEGEIEVRAGVQKYEYPANWKLQAENWLDGNHPQFVHETAFQVLTSRAADEASSESVSGRWPGTARTFVHGHGVVQAPHADDIPEIAEEWEKGIKRRPEYFQKLAKRLGEKRAKEVMNHTVHCYVFPNLLLYNYRDESYRNQHFRIVQPVAVDRSRIYAMPFTLKGAPDEINDVAPHMTSWWASPAGYGQPDDAEAFVRVQEGMHVVGEDWVRFDRGLHREQVSSNGNERYSDYTDETCLRGIHREWKRLMTLPAA